MSESSLSNARSPVLLGNAIRGMREDAGLTQSALARLAGVSRQWLSEVEGGKETAEIGRICQVLDALGARLLVEWPQEPDHG